MLRKQMVIVLATVVVVSSSVTAFAVNSLDFSNKADQWVTKNCTQKALARKNSDMADATCFTFGQIQKNSVDITKLQEAKTAASSYTLHEWQGPLTGYSPTETGTLETVIAPTDGTITTITAINTNYNNGMTISGGTTSLQVVVNGTLQNLSTTLDASHQMNINSTGKVSVKAGDLIQIRQVTTDIKITTPNTYPGNAPVRVSLQVTN